MKSRVTQLLSKYIGAGLVAASVWMFGQLPEGDAASLREYAEVIAVALIGIGGFALEGLIHKLQTGGFFKSAGTPKEPK